jgi:uncharacterized membrane protein YraQ (UPF0718 family)
VNTFILFFDNLLQLSVEASLWLLFGLLIAGLMKAWVSTKILSLHLGHGNKAIIKAAFIDAPLPLCLCSVIPVATELRRSGASAPGSAAFLVATPETGVDSVSVSYALLGPVLAIYRPVTAILSAIFTSMIVATSKESFTQVKSHNTHNELTPCCAKSTTTVVAEMAKPISSCCTSKATELSHSILSNSVLSHSVTAKTLNGIRYSATRLIDDLVRGLLFRFIVCHCGKNICTYNIFIKLWQWLRRYIGDDCTVDSYVYMRYCLNTYCRWLHYGRHFSWYCISLYDGRAGH